MKYKQTAVYILLAIGIMSFLTSCTSVQVDLSKPELVVQEFMRGQATDNRRLVDAVLAADFKKDFKEQKLYLYDRESIPKGTMAKSESLLAWDEPDKKVYQINYTIEYKIEGEAKKLGLKEAVSLTEKDNNWYIDEYVPDKNEN